MIPKFSMSKFRGIRWYRPTVLLAVAIFLFAPLAAYVPLSLATLLPLMVLLIFADRFVSGTMNLRIDKFSTFIVIMILAVAAASTTWSYSIDLTWDKLPRTALIGGLGVLFIGAMAGLGTLRNQTLCRLLLISVALTVAAIVIERLVGEIRMSVGAVDYSRVHLLNTFNRPLSVLSVMLWPIVVILWDKRPVYGLSVVAAFFAIFATFDTGAATAAVAFGALIFGIVYMAPRIMAPLTGIVLGISVLLAPTINQMLPSPKAMFESYELPRSAYHRLLIWNFTSGKIAERPLLGWGFNTSRAIPGGKENLDASEAALPLHPHNAALQWRLELGIPGVILGAGLFVAAGFGAGRYGRNRVAQAGGSATMASAFTIGMLSFGAWQSWWLSGLFIITGIAVLVFHHPRKTTDDR